MLMDQAFPRARANEDRFQLLIDSIEDYAIYMLDPTGHVVTWNRGAEINKGFMSSEILGSHFKTFFVPEDSANGVPEHEMAVAAETGRCAGEDWRLRKDGTRFWATFVLTAMRNPTGELIGFAKVMRDLSERKQHEDAMLAMDAALREERDRFREERDRFLAAAESSLDAFYTCRAVRGADGEIEDFMFTYLNSNAEKTISIPRNQMLGRGMCEVFPENRTNGMFEQYKRIVLTEEALIMEFPVEDRGLKGSWIRIQAVKLRDGIAVTASDITERKENEARMAHLAEHDPLTGLPNRSVLAERVGHAIKRANRYGTRMGMLLIDMDSFKQINDTLGHAVGDHVLSCIANRLEGTVREMDSVIRIGGDEFVIVVPEVAHAGDMRALAGKILDCLRKPIVMDEHTVQASCSVGIALYPDHAESLSELLSCADSAMYVAKKQGKNQDAYFNTTGLS